MKDELPYTCEYFKNIDEFLKHITEIDHREDKKEYITCCRHVTSNETSYMKDNEDNFDVWLLKFRHSSPDILAIVKVPENIHEYYRLLERVFPENYEDPKQQKRTAEYEKLVEKWKKEDWEEDLKERYSEE